MSALETARQIDGSPPPFQRALLFADLAVLQTDAEQVRKRIAGALATAMAEAKADSVDEARNRTGHILLLAWLSARSGSLAPAEAALAKMGGDTTVATSPVLSALLVLVKAQIAVAGGHPEDAVSTLLPQLDGSELCIVHVVLLDAYQRTGDNAHALEQARWLADHPGRAYAEYNLDKALMPFNVAQNRLAVLAVAELSAKRGDRAAARGALEVFKRDWREEGATAPVLARVKALQGLLSP